MRERPDAPFVGGGDRERLFRAAGRHSRWVRFYRRAIPVSLLAILASIAASAYFQPLRLLSRLPVDKLVISDGKLTMESPRLSGFTRDGRPYDLVASAAAQSLTNPGVLELKDVRAKVTMQDKSVIEVQADKGIYDTRSDEMVLNQNVTMISSTGYTVHMQNAHIDNKTGQVVSDTPPVEVILSNGTVKAKRIEVTDNGDIIRFSGGVETYMVPQNADAGASGTTGGAALPAPAPSPAPALAPAPAPSSRKSHKGR